MVADVWYPPIFTVTLNPTAFSRQPLDSSVQSEHSLPLPQRVKHSSLFIWIKISELYMVSQILDCVLTSMLPLHSHVTRFTFLYNSQHRILVWEIHSLDSETQVCLLFLLRDTGTCVVSKIICRIKILWSISSRESRGKI